MKGYVNLSTVSSESKMLDGGFITYKLNGRRRMQNIYMLWV